MIACLALASANPGNCILVSGTTERGLASHASRVASSHRRPLSRPAIIPAEYANVACPPQRLPTIPFSGGPTPTDALGPTEWQTLHGPKIGLGSPDLAFGA